MDSSDYSPSNLQGPSLHEHVGEVSFHPAAAGGNKTGALDPWIRLWN